MTDRENLPSSADEQSLNFSLPVYQGPLDLLLHLIKRAELDPRDVSASVITEQYLTQLELMQQLNLDVAGEYLVMAATLLLIKSYTLLPHPGPADAEEAEELQRDLVERLLEYQRYREAAAKLGEREILGRDVFASPGEKAPPPSVKEPPYRVTVFDLVAAMAAVLKRVNERTPRTIALRDIPVAQCIPRILAALDGAERVEFEQLFETMTERALVIATFMALLELIRRGMVRAWQEAAGGAIYLSRGARYAPPEAAGAPNDESEAGNQPADKQEE